MSVKKPARDLVPGDRIRQGLQTVRTVVEVREGRADKGGPWLVVHTVEPCASQPNGTFAWQHKCRPDSLVTLDDGADPSAPDGPPKGVHVRTWSSDSAVVTDMTNAGRRGKLCRKLVVSGTLGAFDSPEAHRASDWTADILRNLRALTGAEPFDVVRERVVDRIGAAHADGVPNGYLQMYEGTIRGIDAPKPCLTAGVEGKWGASAGEDGISISAYDDVNEWREATSGQTNARAYAIAVSVWPQVQAATTLHEASRILADAGARLHGWCGMD